MEPFDSQDLIEQYLNGTLSAEKKGALEARMEQDPGFRTELELHRQLHAEFADPQKLALRDMLAEIVHETEEKPDSRHRWWIWVLIGGLLLTGIWFIQQRSPLQQPVEQEKQQGAPGQAPVTPVVPQTPVVSQQPIAQASGPRFKPNPDFESRLGNGGIRSGTSEEVVMQRPTPNADFKAENGMVPLVFQGLAPANNDLTKTSLSINIYDNRPNSTALFELSANVELAADNLDQWPFRTIKRLRLEPGIYYYTLEWQETAELLFVGRFTVGAK